MIENLREYWFERKEEIIVRQYGNQKQKVRIGYWLVNGNPKRHLREQFRTCWFCRKHFKEKEIFLKFKPVPKSDKWGRLLMDNEFPQNKYLSFHKECWLKYSPEKRRK